MTRYITPILEHPSLELYRFSPDIPNHQEAMNLMRKAFDCYTAELEGYGKFFSLTQKISRQEQKNAPEMTELRL